MTDDARDRLARARRIYAEALAERGMATPGEPGYRVAVHRVGVAWTQVLHWERTVREARRREELEGG